MSGRCLVGVWEVSGRGLGGVWEVSGRCLGGVWELCGSCLGGVLEVSWGGLVCVVKSKVTSWKKKNSNN